MEGGGVWELGQGSRGGRRGISGEGGGCRETCRGAGGGGGVPVGREGEQQMSKGPLWGGPPVGFRPCRETYGRKGSEGVRA